MTIFNDTADALGVSPDTRTRAWSAVGGAGISPDDPEVVRLLINEHIRATLTSLTGDLETAAGKAIREFGDAAAHGEAADRHGSKPARLNWRRRSRPGWQRRSSRRWISGPKRNWTLPRQRNGHAA